MTLKQSSMWIWNYSYNLTFYEIMLQVSFSVNKYLCDSAEVKNGGAIPLLPCMSSWHSA
jgi:hypothetical protein